MLALSMDLSYGTLAATLTKLMELLSGKFLNSEMKDRADPLSLDGITSLYAAGINWCQTNNYNYSNPEPGRACLF